MELNHILLFLALVSPLAVLARAWRPGPTHRGWRVAAFAVLAVTGLAWIFFRRQAGFIGSTAWFLLLFLPAVGMRRVVNLSAHHRYKSARRMTMILQWLHPSRELREQAQLLHTLESRQDAGLIPGALERAAFPNRPWPLHHAPTVLALILLNVAAFLLEFSHRNWSEWTIFHRFGALEPSSVVTNHEYWRLFTALFLHFNTIHLLFNLFALYVLGPPLERAIGSVRFSACYLISGLGSSAGVVVLWMLRWTDSAQVVGASGCIMGIVGAWAAFLLRHRHTLLVTQRLWNIAMIVAIQVAFDLSTREVSMSAHLCGLCAGFLAGLALAPRRIDDAFRAAQA